jgi:hypothetical protein
MIALIIGLFNLHVGYMLRDTTTTFGKLIQAGNFISCGANLVIAAVQLS